MKPLFAITAVLTLAASLSQAATVSTIDTIDDADHFYGFEDLPRARSYALISGVETTTGDNITVTQVNGLSAIWTTFLPGGGEGDRAWFPVSGDNGYTAIKTADGSDLDALGLLVGSGFIRDIAGHYSLRLDGAEVASGSFVNSREFSYLSFSGTIFDEVYLLSTPTSSFSFFGDGTFNGLVVDAIEVSLAPPATIPLPAGGLLLLSGLAGMGAMRRLKRG